MARQKHDPRWKEPQQGILSGVRWATWMGEVGVKPTPVPSEYWTLAEWSEETASRAVVCCPCGAEPEVEEFKTPSKCECGRAYFFGGGCVWVFNSEPTRQAELDAATVVPS